jgi:hypothetical protein
MMLLLPAARCYAVAGPIADKSTKGSVGGIFKNLEHWIFFGYVIVQALRQQRDLRPSLTFNESLHDRPQYDLDDQKVRQTLAFSHSLDPKRTCFARFNL